MGSRNLHRRQAKAVRRKKVLAERRRLETAGGQGRLARDVRRSRTAPLRSCLVQSGLFENGFGMVALTRKTGARTLALAAFLVDAFCLGVKDALFRELEEAKMESFLEAFEETAPFEEVDPSYARKLLRDAAAYGGSLGLEPHSDYAALESFFDDIDADACQVEFQFGFRGKPLYVPGPTESRTQIRRRFDLLSRRLGVDGFEFREIEHPFGDLEGSDGEDEDTEIEADEDFDIADA